jgi:AcrR family transcriptional regulator
MKQVRMKPDARKEDIMAAALPLAERKGYNRITRDEIALAAKVKGPVLHYHFGSMEQFRRSLMRYAVKHRCLRVIAQGIVANDAQALKVDEATRREALAAF